MALPACSLHIDLAVGSRGADKPIDLEGPGTGLIMRFNLVFPFRVWGRGAGIIDSSRRSKVYDHSTRKTEREPKSSAE